MPRGTPNNAGATRAPARTGETVPTQAAGLPGLPVAGIPPVERPPEPPVAAAVTEDDATRFWPITESSPIPNTVDRFRPAGPVDLLIAGVVVPGARWGMYSTTNGGRVWAWIAPDGRNWPQMEPEGWRLPLVGRKAAAPTAA